MRTLSIVLVLFYAGILQPQVPSTPDPSKDLVWICPMDKDIRSNGPGNCSRCGMKLVAGIPDPVEYHLDLSVTPWPPNPQQKPRLRFDFHDPWKNNSENFVSGEGTGGVV